MNEPDDGFETLEDTIDNLAQTVEEHIALFHELRQQRDALKAALEAIQQTTSEDWVFEQARAALAALKGDPVSRLAIDALKEMK